MEHDVKEKYMETNTAPAFTGDEKPYGFLIVGIDASAGGIQGLKEFFQQVPADSGMAYVVILHLSPSHDSKLAEALQVVAAIPVQQVTETVRIEPNHIYVIAPDNHPEMLDDMLVPTPNLPVDERRAPVDIFFRHLSDTYGPRAVCVVLSGTGANGSMGLKRIKERGGVAYVQDPREGKFNEIFRNSMATELIDEVLPAAEIPAHIIAYRNRLGSVQIASEPIPESVPHFHFAKTDTLQKASDRYLSLFNSIDEGFCVFELQYDADGNAVDWIYTEANPAFEKQTGFMNPVGQRISHFQPGLERSWFKRFAEVDRSGEPVRFIQYTEAMGVWYDVYALRAGEAGQHQISLLFTDITERKNQEERQQYLLQLSDALRAFSNPDDVLWEALKTVGEYLNLDRVIYNEIDPEVTTYSTRVNYLKPGFSSVVGSLSMEPFKETVRGLQKGITYIQRDVERDDKLSKAEKQACRSIQVQAFVTVPLVKKGQWVCNLVAHYSKPRNWTPHEIAILKETAERIWTAVERAKAEEALQESEAKYRTLFQSIDEGFALIEFPAGSESRSPDFRFVEVNESFERQTGNQDVTGKLGSEINPGVDEVWIKAFSGVARSGEPRRLEIHHQQTGRWYDMFATRVGDAENRQVCVLFQNITERKRREADLAFLSEVSQELVRLTNIDKTMNAVGEKLAVYFGLSACVFAEQEFKDGVQLSHLNHGWHRADTPSLLGTYRMKEFMTQEMIDMCYAEEPIIIRDVFADPKTDGPKFAAINVGSFVGIPLVRDGEWRFLLVVYRSEPYDWRADQVELLRELMNRIWTRLERARAEEALRESEERQAFMLQLTDKLRPLRNAFAIEQEACELLGDRLHADHTYYAEIDVAADYGVIRHDHVRNGATPYVAEYRVSDLGFVIPLYQRGEPVVVNDVFTSPLIPEADRAATAASHIAWIAVPVVKDNTLLGALCVTMSSSRTWTDRETELVAETAERVWNAIERARAEEALYESEARLQLALGAAGLGTFVWYLTEDRTEADARALAHFGLPPDTKSTLADSLARIFHPEDGPRYVKAIERAVDPAGPGTMHEEFRIRRTDGERWMSVIAKAVFEGSPPVATRISGVLADITERKQQEERQAFLLKLSDALRPLGDPHEMQATAADLLGRHLGVDRSNYYEVDVDGWAMRSHGFANGEVTIPAKIRLADLGQQWVNSCRAGRTVVVSDIATDERFLDEERAAWEAGRLSSMLAVPLVKQGRLCAVFGVEHAQPRRWTDLQIALVEETAERTWAAVERASAEQALQESEERFRSLVTATSDTVYKMSADWKVMHELEGKSFLRTTTDANNAWVETYIPEQEKGRVSEAINSAIENKTIFELEHRVFDLAGNIAWTYSRAVPKLNEEKEIIEWIGVASDITLRKNAEQELRDSEHRLQRMVNIPYVGVLTFNHEGKLLSANDAFLKMVGYSRQDFEAQKFTWQLFTPAEHVEESEKVMQQLRDTGAGGPYTKEYYRKDGSKVWLLFVAAHLSDNTIVEYAIDVSDQKKAEEALRLSEERISKLISLMPAAVYTCDAEGRLTYFNQQAVEMWGRKPKTGDEQDKYCGSFRMWTPDGKLLKHGDCPMADAVHEGRSARNEEVVIEQPSGAYIIANVNIDPLYNREGQLIGAINVFVDITERKRAEKALRESEERLRLATRAANIFSWSYDVKSGVYSSSDNAAAILGISRLPRTPEDTDGLVYPDDKHLIQQQLQTAIAEANGFNIDFRSVKDDGTIVWLSVQTTMLTDKEGNASQLLGIAQDISERKEAEGALQKSESRFRTLADAVPQIIWTNEPDGKAAFFNQRWYDYSGLTYEQSFGKGWQAIVHPDDAPASTEKWNTALAQGKIFDTEYRLRNAEGHYCWFVGRNVPLKNEAGNVIGWFGSATDINDLKNVEEALRQSKGRLQLIIESAKGFAIFTTTVDDIIDSWSSGAAEIFGWREEEIIGKNADVLFTPEDREQNQPRKELEQAVTEGVAPNVRWHLHKNGSLIFINGAVHPAYNAEGALSGFVKIGRDMTAQHNAETALRKSEEIYRTTLEKEVEQRTAELKESNNSLRYANENLQQFATIASHDLQEPLRKLRMFASVLQRFKAELPEEGREVLSKIRTTSDRMSLLIREVLQYSKIAYGIKELVAIDLDTILKNVLGDLELLLADTEATITYDGALPQIDAIPLQMNQLFYNLLTNALKFRKDGVKPHIRISASPVAVDDLKKYATLHQNKAYVEIRFTDNGIGFDKQFSEQIFQIFERLHSAEEFEGTGVGLALCKKIVENHNGHIFATSKEGEGATFTIILPVIQ